MNDLPYAISAGTGVAIDHSVLLFGGDKGETFSRTEQLIAAISNATGSAERKKLEEEKARLQSSHPGFSREVMQYDLITGDITFIGAMPYESPVTTSAIRCGDHVFIPLGEVRAGIRTPYILKATIIHTGNKN